MSQNNISRLESPDYGRHSLTSLKKLAAALDVALAVRFVPFSQYVDWLSGTPFLDEGIRPEALAVPSFEDEEADGKSERKTIYWSVTVDACPSSLTSKTLTAKTLSMESGGLCQSVGSPALNVYESREDAA